MEVEAMRSYKNRYGIELQVFIMNTFINNEILPNGHQYDQKRMENQLADLNLKHTLKKGVFSLDI